jgi:nucleoid-associated protein YgaU
MRKDAKIGFAIGGVLLAVLTVYAVVVGPRHKKTSSTVSLVKPADTTAQPPAMTASIDGSGASQPIVFQKEPALPPAPVNNAGSSNPVSGNSATAGGGVTDPATPSDLPHDAPKPDPNKVLGFKPAGVPVDDAGPMTYDQTDSHALHDGKAKTLQIDAPASLAGDDRIYTVQAGQTLGVIAKEVYGNSRFYLAIERENPSVDERHLKIGQKIKLPDITPLRPELASDVELAQPARSDRHASGESSTDQPSATDPHSYAVKPGDTLYKIARVQLGSGRKADALYALNKDRIGPDKDRLKLGLVLRLPDASGAGLARTDVIR